MKVLFICEGNAARSQVAEAYLRALRPDLVVMSAGTKADETKAIPAHVAQVMSEDGQELEGAVRTKLTQNRIDDADFIVSFLPQDELPDDIKVDQFWQVADPRFGDVDFHREVRNQIHKHVSDLANEL